jgi:hypothetical protein
MTCRIDRPMRDLGARRIFAEEVIALPILGWPYGSGDKTAAAIWTDVAQNLIDTGLAKRAFIAANACLEGGRRQCFVAVLAGGSEFQHSPSGSGQ